MHNKYAYTKIVVGDKTYRINLTDGDFSPSVNSFDMLLKQTNFSETGKVLYSYNKAEGKKETFTYDKNGNITHKSVYCRYGYDDIFFKYDKYNNPIEIICFTNSKCIGRKTFEYDETGKNVVMYKYDNYHRDSTTKETYHYNNKGNMIYTIVDNGSTISIKFADGDKSEHINTTMRLDERRFKEYQKLNPNFTPNIIFKDNIPSKHTPKSQIVYEKTKSGLEKWSEYDDNGNLIHYKNSKGYEKWVTYDDRGFWLSIKNTKGYEHVREWDAENKYFRTVFCTDESKVRV